MDEGERRKMQMTSLRGHVRTLKRFRKLLDDPKFFANCQRIFKEAGMGLNTNDLAAMLDGMAKVSKAFMDGITLRDLE